MGVITREVAKADIDKWLDHKRVGDKKKETYNEQVEFLIDAVMEGKLSVDDNFNLVQKIQEPSPSENAIKELVFKPRLRMNEVHSQLQNVKSTDADGRVSAYIAALTGKPRAAIVAMDTEDYAIGQNIAIFFL